jgi:hypothetical protein
MGEMKDPKNRAPALRLGALLAASLHRLERRFLPDEDSSSPGPLFCDSGTL